MTLADVSSFLYACADALAIPRHVVMAAFVTACVWVLYKWGALIFSIYALVCFCNRDWSTASLAAILALSFRFVRSFVQALDAILCGIEPRRSRD